MEQSSPNQAQPISQTPVRKHPMSDPVPTPPVSQHSATPLSQALAQFLIAEANASMPNPSHLNKRPVIGIPLASDMSEAEASEAIAKGVDPWSLDLNGTERPQPVSLPVQTLLTVTEFAAMFATDADTGPLFAPGEMTIFVVDDPRQRARVIDTSADLIGVLRQMPHYKDAELGVISLITSQPTTNRNFRTKPAEQRQAFHKEVDKALADGDAVIVICDRLDALSDIAQAVSFTTYEWPQFTSDMLLGLLKQTHSATGQIAKDAIAQILPSDAALTAMPLTLFTHAFRAPSSIAVAQRLAKYDTPIEQKPAGLTLSDVKGLPDVCSKLTAMITDLKDWQAGKVTWSDVSASALFYGPPGSGKTMLAEAMAGSAGVHFVATSYTDLQASGHLGDYLKAMSEVVKEAIKNAPSVIFFDELDSFGSRSGPAGSTYSRYMTSVINDMLQQLTRLNAAEGVIVLAATNFIERIDPAILRSGRFDAKIAVPYPDKSGVRDILTHHIGSDFAADDQVINRLLGLSGADLANIARDAKGRARRTRSPVTAQHLSEAVVAAVPPTLDLDLRRIAAHEAGHIVMAAMLDMPLPFKAQISPNGGAVTRPAPTLYTPQSIKNELAYFMGGRAAEKITTGTISSGSGTSEQSDLDQATALAVAQERQWGLGKSGLIYAPVDSDKRHMLTAPQQHTINERLKAAESLAIQTLKENRELLTSVTEALLEERELDSRQIVDLVVTMGQSQQQEQLNAHGADTLSM
jgi:cell division protease FtsH